MRGALVAALLLAGAAFAELTPEQVGEVRARYKQGTALAREGKFADGAAVFKQVLRDHGANVSHSARTKLYYAVGFCYLKAGQPLRAKRAVERCVELAPESEKVKALAADLARALAPPDDDDDDRPPPPTPTPAPTASPKASVPPPPPTAAEAKAAFQEGEAGYAQVLKLIEQAQDIDKPLAEALAKLDVARRGNHRLPRTLFLIGGLRLRRAEDGDAAEAAALLEESQKLEPDTRTLLELGAAYGLVPDSEKEIAAYEKALEAEPNHAEGHFRAAIAYDKSKRTDAARLTFEHAKAAIRIDSKYKQRFQNMLKNSDVAAKIAEMVNKIIGESEGDELTEDKVNEYAKRFEAMLGNTDPAKKAEEFQRLLKDPKIQKVLERLPKEQREHVLKTKDPGKLLELLIKHGVTPARK